MDIQFLPVKPDINVDDCMATLVENIKTMIRIDDIVANNTTGIKSDKFEAMIDEFDEATAQVMDMGRLLLEYYAD
jgi:hypothetical protein